MNADDPKNSLKSVPLEHTAAPLQAGHHTEAELIAVQNALRESNERIIRLLESITDGFTVIDRQWRFVYLNARAMDFFHRLNRTREGTLGKNIWEEFPDVVGTVLEDHFVKTMETNVTSAFEFFYPPLQTWFLFRVYPGKDGLSIYFQDVTERMQAEEESRAYEERLRAIFNQAAVGIAVADLGGRFLEMNKKFTEILGYAEKELKSLDYNTITHPDDLELTRKSMVRLMSGEIPEYVIEKRFVRKDGKTVWALTTVTALRDVNGQPQQYIGVIEDITARRGMEDALREADRRKDEFLATLAHELRNPLAPIRHAATLLNSTVANEAQRRWGSEVIARQVGHMALLLDDLLDISRITRGRLEIKKDYTTLQSLVSTAVETARPLIDAKKHALHVNLPEQTLHLEVDPLRISQVLSNLLTNAAKYTDANGRIVMTAELRFNALRISVKDNGIGLRPETIPKLFEMFSQVDSAIDRSQGGLGIGLALVKGLVELHGGTVGANSAGLGQGSEFVVILPDSTCSRLDGEATPNETKAASSDAKCRVLIVDDNRDAVAALAVVLQLQGHEVFTAHSGADALAVAARERPPALILDIGMPGMSGYELTRRIRQEAWGRHALIIAVTGWGQEEDSRQSFAAGFDHHLTKPIDVAKIEELLAKVI